MEKDHQMTIHVEFGLSSIDMLLEVNISTFFNINIYMLISSNFKQDRRLTLQNDNKVTA